MQRNRTPVGIDKMFVFPQQTTPGRPTARSGPGFGRGRATLVLAAGVQQGVAALALQLAGRLDLNLLLHGAHEPRLHLGDAGLRRVRQSCSASKKKKSHNTSPQPGL